MFKAARSGKGRLVIGARSAIFCPLENLGLIIVDEEQDHSYKQDDPAPRYNARDLALKRGQIAGAVVVLGSATPSVESYHAAACGKLDFLTLPQRVAGSGNPGIKIISTAIKPEQKRDSRLVFPRGFWPISEALYTELSIRMKRKEQVIILLNRRGYSSSVVCFECGWLGKCPDCDIGWTYYKSRNKVACHYCGMEKMGPTVCPKCESANLSFRGAGTERLEETLRQLFPGATIRRLDSDVALRKWKSRDILDEFGRGGFRILIGTQMVAKGHHFPAVGFVAIIGADIGLSLPDFRATERVLQLLVQASGRAGRSGKKSASGTVMVQTFAPQAIIFKYLKAHDYTGFLESEIKVREAMGYPPFKKLIQAIVSSNSPSKASRGAKSLKEDIKDISVDKHIEVLGPAQSPIFKRGKHYRFQILLKIALEDEPEDLLRVLNEAARRARGFSVKIDVDPLTFV
jgi:primosomal protein N' (replication factor Y)